MIILSCSNVCLSFAERKLLENITFTIQETDRTGLIGVNGAGKSTLFKLICGIIKPDSGDIWIAKDVRVGYLSQDSGLTSSATIWDEILSAFSYLVEMENRIYYLQEKISTENDADRLSPYMKEYAVLTDRFTLSGGYEYNSRIKGVLRGLGFDDSQFCLKVENLSGGQKTRLALAKLLLEEPDILLLDEPTNHLDINSLEWLEDFLANYRKCVLVISHDRYFLDVVTNRTIEIENCECMDYRCNYSAFVRKKQEDMETRQKHYEQQQKEIARMENMIEQYRRWNREKSIIAAESKQKALDRMKKIDRPAGPPDRIHISLRSNNISGNDVLCVENVSKGYQGRVLLKDISFSIKRGEKVFLLGPNGCGKTTLLKILTGRLERDSGRIEYGYKLNIGYFDQEQENLDGNNSVIEEVWDSNDRLTQTQVRNALASFLFKGEDVFKPVTALSGGEKSRIAILKLMLSGVNFLILDEPTNHLDINSREALEKSLYDYDGTILVVSHDRYFTNKLAARVLEIENGCILDYKGNYDFYTGYKNRLKKAASANPPQEKPSVSKIERVAAKEEKAKQRKIERQLNETENRIHEIETRLGIIRAEMDDNETASDHIRLTELYEEQNNLKPELEELYILWDSLMLQKKELYESMGISDV